MSTNFDNDIFLSWACVHCGRGFLSVKKPRSERNVKDHVCEYEREREPQDREQFKGWTKEQIDYFIQRQGRLFDEEGETV